MKKIRLKRKKNSNLNIKEDNIKVNRMDITNSSNYQNNENIENNKINRNIRNKEKHIDGDKKEKIRKKIFDLLFTPYILLLVLFIYALESIGRVGEEFFFITYFILQKARLIPALVLINKYFKEKASKTLNLTIVITNIITDILISTQLFITELDSPIIAIIAIILFFAIKIPMIIYAIRIVGRENFKLYFNKYLLIKYLLYLEIAIVFFVMIITFDVSDHRFVPYNPC